MRLQVSGLEHIAKAQLRRYANASGAFNSTSSGSAGSSSSPNNGLNIVIPLISGFCGLLLLMTVLIVGFRVWKQQRPAAQETSITPRVPRQKKKPPVLTGPILGSLPILRFEIADHNICTTERCFDPISPTGGAIIGTSVEQCPDTDVALQSLPCAAERNDVRPPWRGAFTQCTICEEEFQEGQDVRLLPCDHGYHPACIDIWLLNMSATCPLW